MKNYLSAAFTTPAQRLTSGKLLWLLGLALSCGLAANPALAHDADQANTGKKHPKTTKAQGMSNENLKGTAKTSKTGMGVELDYAFASAAVDRAGLLQLTVTRRGGGDNATITIQPEAGLRLAQGLPSANAPFGPGASYTLKVQPLTDGLRYLNVFLKAGTQSESLAIAVHLGKDTKFQKSGTVQTMPNGQRVISVPAQ